ncbi:MAG: DNA internalization-related competence protein ComEC/Rec2 [Bacteroidetes Order II. Incertae sedis bacterium]|nr:DNA internalization-related competence protein ComEC/Rec2 [Bacteroidetes Order II. bacterium]
MYSSASLIARWRSFPMLMVVLLMGSGIMAAPLFAHEDWFLGTIMLLCWIFATSLLPERKLVSLRPLFRGIGLGLLCFVFGGLRMSADLNSAPNDISHFITEPITSGQTLVYGEVSDFPVRYRSGLRFTLKVFGIEQNRYQVASGKVLVYLKLNPESGLPDLHWGDHIQVAGRLERPKPKRNPADFDFATYLSHKNIQSVLYVREPQTLSRTGNTNGWIHRSVNHLREKIRHTITHYTASNEMASMQKALLIGDRTDLPENLKQSFNNTGLTHLLAVSGLHVLLIGMVLFNLLRPLLGRIKRLSWTAIEVIRCTVTFVVLIFFLWITGGSPSVIRAVVMAAVFLSATLIQRDTSGLNSLGVAMFIMLLLQPGTLYDIGFQLSCAAVAGIVIFQPSLQRITKYKPIRHDWQKAGIQSIGVSVVATAATAPILLYHFGQVSLAGVWLNLVAIPLSDLAILSILLTVVLDWFVPSVAFVMGNTASALTSLFTGFVSISDTYFGHFRIHGFVTSLWLILSLLLALFMFAQWDFPRIRYRTAIAALFFALIGFTLPRISSSLSPQLKVTFFDVGQGDAALIEFPNGKTLLIDAGDRNEFYDAGLSTIIPHLRKLNRNRLDVVVISHPHQDHMGGLPSLLTQLDIGEVFTNLQPCQSNICIEVDSLALVRNVAIKGLQRGMFLQLDPSVLVEVLAPVSKPLAHQDVNSHSIVLRIQHGTHQFLFMGDGTAFTEYGLIQTNPVALASDVVKVGHHGSATSSTPEFIQRVMKPKTKAVVSVAERNVYRLPNENVLGRWRYFGAEVVETRSEGAIIFTASAKGVKQVAWR